jgi:hypothetical protein
LIGWCIAVSIWKLHGWLKVWIWLAIECMPRGQLVALQCVGPTGAVVAPVLGAPAADLAHLYAPACMAPVVHLGSLSYCPPSIATALARLAIG